MSDEQTSAEALHDRASQAWFDFYQTSEGQLAIGYLLADLGLYEEIQGGDSMSIGIKVGERNVGAKIARLLRRKPQEFVADVVEDVDAIDGLLTSLMASQGD